MNDHTKDGSSRPPHVRHDFRETQPDRELPAEEKKKIQHSRPVTATEADTLDAQRAVPEVEQSLTPGGMLEQNSHEQVERKRQRTLAEVREKLNRSSRDMRKRFNRSR